MTILEVSVKDIADKTAIGTPYCVTVDFNTLEDSSVTIRDRDTMQQIRLQITDLEKYLSVKVFY